MKKREGSVWLAAGKREIMKEKRKGCFAQERGGR